MMTHRSCSCCQISAPQFLYFLISFIFNWKQALIYVLLTTYWIYSPESFAALLQKSSGSRCRNSSLLWNRCLGESLLIWWTLLVLMLISGLPWWHETNFHNLVLVTEFFQLFLFPFLYFWTCICKLWSLIPFQSKKLIMHLTNRAGYC